MRPPIAIAVAFGLMPALFARPAAAQSGSATGTTETSIRQVWKAYVDSKKGQFAAKAGTRSTLWLSSEQDRWPMFDLAGFYIPDGAVAEVQSIRRAQSPDEYEIVALFRASGSPAPPPITIAVYGVREKGRWVLANALPRRTANWQRHVVGPITYHVDPRLTFSPVRARQAVAFTDSVAEAFAVPRLSPTDYYVASSVDVAMWSLGVTTVERYGAAGGFSKPVNDQLFSGIPEQGENYRHELVHLLLRPLLAGTTTIIASEGAATWLGGTAGNDFRGSVRALDRYLTETPGVTLDSLIDSRSIPQAMRYTAGAVLCEMLSRRGGAPLVAKFQRAGPGSNQLRAEIVRMLERPWPSIASDWRRLVHRLAEP